jgi:Ras association (RalGDS/AF-6) domain
MDNNRFIVSVFVGALSQLYEALSVEASKQTTCLEIVSCIVERLKLAPGPDEYELAEVVGQECKERSLASDECPVALMLLWPRQVCFKCCVRHPLNTSECDTMLSPSHNIKHDTQYLFSLKMISFYLEQFEFLLFNLIRLFRKRRLVGLYCV